MIFDFTESEYTRIGKILANRDAFIILFELGQRERPFSISELCGKFKTEPGVITDIVRHVVHLGFAVGADSYSLTPIGLAVVDFIESRLKDDPVCYAQAQSDLAARGAINSLPGVSWTNNSVIGTFTGEGSIAEDIIQPMPTPIPDSGLDDEEFRSQDEARTNATRSHTHL